MSKHKENPIIRLFAFWVGWKLAARWIPWLKDDDSLHF